MKKQRLNSIKNVFLLKTKIARFAAIFILGILVQTTVNAQCERVSGSVFPVAGGNVNTVPGWNTVTGTTSANWPAVSVHLNPRGLEFRRDQNTITNLSQSLTGIRPSSVLNINGLYWVKTQVVPNSASFLTVSYSGITYAIINTTTTNTPTIIFSNGATGNINSLPTISGSSTQNNYLSSTPVNLSITLPSGISASGQLLFTFTAGSEPTEVRDLGMKSVSIENPPTVITVQPNATPQSVCQGTAATPLSINGTGTGPFTFQWYSNVNNNTNVSGRTAIAGATSSTFTPPTTAVGTLYYHVIVTGCDSETSTTSGVTVLAPTAITAQAAASQTVCQNVAVPALAVTASGSSPITYQWYSNTTNSTSTTGRTTIFGATANSYVPPSTSTGTVYYHVIVNGACGNVTSNVYAVIVNAATAITSQPTPSQNVCQNTAATPLSISATGTGTLTYQWYKNASNTVSTTGRSIATGTGSTSSTYTPPTSAVGTLYYHVIVTGTCGNVTSTISKIEVSPATTISNQPLANQTVAPNASPVSIAVTASGTGTLNYQWYSNNSNNNTTGTAIAGAVSTTFSPPSSNIENIKYYYVIVSGSCPDVASNVAKVEVACTEQVLGETFTAQDGVEKTFNQPATNFGFVFDITKLDNSFNMKINGTALTTQEIQFQSGGGLTINVRFADGTGYTPSGANGGTPEIYNMTGTAAAPIISVVISPTGAVSMFGSKVAGGVLFPLILTNGNAFNNITWNSGATNTVVIDQLVTGITNITGRGYGLNKVNCACYDDANLSTVGLTATPTGISLLKRAEDATGVWPGVRKSAFVAIESNTKGFVITRMTSDPAQTTASNYINKITNPQEGMIIFDTFTNCLKLYDGTKWDCFTTPACP